MENQGKKKIGNVLIVVLALLPIFLWLPIMPLADRFANGAATFRAIGQLTALVGTALLAINFILSGKFKFFDLLFSPGRVYKSHMLVGPISFSLLLFHPVFLTLQVLTFSLNAGYDFVFGFGSWPLLLGKVGLAIMIVLLVITIYFRLQMKYQIWRTTHKFLGLALLFGSTHMFFIGSSIAASPWLKYYMLGLIFWGGYAYFHNTILSIFKKEQTQII